MCEHNEQVIKIFFFAKKVFQPSVKEILNNLHQITF